MVHAQMGSNTQKCIDKSNTDTQFFRKKAIQFCWLKFFCTDEAIEKTKKSFPALMKRYNRLQFVNSFDKATQISRLNVFPRDEAIQYPKVQKFHQ
jgi:hypothetical protein